ncbi:UNVERIFIED_ORG: hypothetical protein BCL66_105242 [Martelella mediterranea]
MAVNRKITSTPTSSLAPIGTAQERDHALLTDALRQHVGEEAAFVLAEPVFSRDGARVDWYSDCPGTIAPLSSLSPEEAEQLRLRLGGIEDAVTNAAKRLEASRDKDDKLLAQALINALSVPGESAIYALGQQPVLTCWGYSAAHVPGYRGGLVKLSPMRKQEPTVRAPTVMAPAAIPEDEGIATPQRQVCRWWLMALLWLVFALLVGAILFLLLRACAFSPAFPWLHYCDARGQNQAAITRIQQLENEVAVLDNAVTLNRRQCTMAAPTFAGPLDNDAINKRLAEADAGSGALEISLIWDGPSDLDLWVNCPDGTINFQQPTACGGTLDIDSNNPVNPRAHPVENVIWEQTPPATAMPVAVMLYDYRGAPPDVDIPYTVRIRRRDGNEVTSQQLFEGVIPAGRMRELMNVTTVGQEP